MNQRAGPEARPRGKLLAAFADGVTGGWLKEIRGRFVAVDADQAEVLLAGARVAVPGHYHGLQLRRIPALAGHLNRTVVADGADLDRVCGAMAFRFDAFDHLRANRFTHLFLHHDGACGSNLPSGDGLRVERDPIVGDGLVAAGLGLGDEFLYLLRIQGLAVDGDGGSTAFALHSHGEGRVGGGGEAQARTDARSRAAADRCSGFLMYEAVGPHRHRQLLTSHRPGVQDIGHVCDWVDDRDVVGSFAACTPFAVAIDGGAILTMDARAVGQHLVGFVDLFTGVRRALHGEAFHGAHHLHLDLSLDLVELRHGLFHLYRILSSRGEGEGRKDRCDL